MFYASALLIYLDWFIQAHRTGIEPIFINFDLDTEQFLIIMG